MALFEKKHSHSDEVIPPLIPKAMSDDDRPFIMHIKNLEKTYDIGTPHILRIDSCLRTTIEELSNTIRNLDDKKYRNNVVENASKLLPQNLAYVGHASEELLLFLKKLTMET